ALALVVQPGAAHRSRGGNAGHQPDPGAQVAVYHADQPADLAENESRGVRWTHRDELAVRVALGAATRGPHDLELRCAVVQDLPVLEGIAPLARVLLVVDAADVAERLELLALLLGELPRFDLAALRAGGHVVMDRFHVVRDLRGEARRARCERALGPCLAPLPEQEHQGLLAGGLDAVLAERNLGRRLPLAQQGNAVAQALCELPGVEVARLRRQRRACRN